MDLRRKVIDKGVVRNIFHRLLPNRIHTIADAANWNVKHHSNAHSSPQSASLPSDSPLQPAGMIKAKEQIANLPAYKPTPIISATDLAAAIGVKELWIKDETNRFGVGSFKPLGGTIAALHLLRNAEAKGFSASDLVLSTASAGNHGIGLAWASRQAGCACRIYISTGVKESMAERMRSLGATVHRVDGDYEDSVAACREESAANGWHLVQDVSWEGYEEIPQRIYEGYTVLSAEVVEQLADAGAETPTHVFVNTGVGGLACGVCAHFWSSYGAARPRFVVVEPKAAACCMHSAKVGQWESLPPSPELTVQTGLDCRVPAPLAWKILHPGATDFVSIGDECVRPTIQILADSARPIVAGESAVARCGHDDISHCELFVRNTSHLPPQNQRYCPPLRMSCITPESKYVNQVITLTQSSHESSAPWIAAWAW